MPQYLYVHYKLNHMSHFLYNSPASYSVGTAISSQVEEVDPLRAMYIGSHRLSPKELKVLVLLCEERTTKEIAALMQLSPRTIEAIRDKLKLKTGSKSLAGLAIFAMKKGLI
jgi:DNA-binding CsgD family transcriptional regulator